MSKTVQVVCDCGCKASANIDLPVGWLRLAQSGAERVREVGLKLSGELHFASLDCLSVWVKKVQILLPNLQSEARDLGVHGQIQSDSLPSIYV